MAESQDMSRAARLAGYGAVSTSLALTSDQRLRELLDAATPVGAGIGGRSALLEVAGTPVFVKQVPLTDRELLPGSARSTANVFGLPTFCQYGMGRSGIGSPGFGAWRELAVHTMTTDWALTGDHDGFPLMYHWRVLPEPEPVPLPEELADMDAAVSAWDGRPEVRGRIEALRQASSSIALFLEYIPQNLHVWLGEQIEGGDHAAADRACAMVERELAAGTSFMNARGLLHFDAHFENILTDGSRLFFTDYGLSLSDRFELSADEAAFFRRNESYDRCYSTTHLVIWLATALFGYWGEDRTAFLRTCAEGERPTGIPEAAADILMRHAPIALVMGDFYRGLRDESRETPYPLDRIRQLGGPYAGSSD